MFILVWLTLSVWSQDLTKFALEAKDPGRQVQAQVRGGEFLFASPDLASGEAFTSIWPWIKRKQRCVGTQELSGRLLSLNSDIAEVELAEMPSSCAASFNGEAKNPRVVYLRASSLASLQSAGESKVTVAPEALALTRSEPRNSERIKCVEPRAERLDESARQIFERANLGLNPPMKTKEEMELYLDCYRTPNQALYQKYYRKLFDLAQSTFRVTYEPSQKDQVAAIVDPQKLQSEYRGQFVVSVNSSVMRCVALRESEWDPRARSQTGALGIGQQTEVNMEHMRCLLEGCVKSEKVFRKDSSGQMVSTLKSVPIEPEPWAVTLWQKYRTEAKKILGSDWAEVSTNPLTGKPCGEKISNKERDAPCAVNSIAAMALYQIVAELELRRASPLYKSTATADFTVEQMLDKALMTGVTNNGGTGTTRKTVRSFDRPEQWTQNIGAMVNGASRRKEVSEYMQYLRNCLRNGESKPYRKFGAKEKQPDCSQIYGASSASKR